MPKTKHSPSFPQSALLGILYTVGSQFFLSYLTLYIQSIYPAWSAPFWPASGAALAACLLRGPWMLLGVYIGLVAPNFLLWSVSPRWIGLVLPLGNVLETALAWYLLRVWIKRFDFRLTRVSDVGTFLALAPWIPAAVSSLFVQTCLYWSKVIPPDRYPSELLIFWLGNATGIMLVTPLILVWRDFSLFHWTGRKGQRTVFLLAAMTVALFLFHSHELPKYIRLFSVLVVPLVAWGVWSTGFRGATLICLVVSFAYFVLDVPNSRPISLLLKEKHLQAGIGFATVLKVDAPLNRILPPPTMIGDVLEQIGVLTTLCLTILPLGAAADELRRKGEQDDLIMQALDASFWSWTGKDGLRIYNTKVAKLIGPHPLLFQAHEPFGKIRVPSLSLNQLDYDSYWTVTETGSHGNPLVVTGILQGRNESAIRRDAEKKSEIDNLKAQALRAHLNPHLIFNCLTGLRSMIKSDRELARVFTGRLARFLRAVVDSQTSTLISLTYEIEICMDYIALESMRGKKIRLDHEPQPQENGIFLPPLSLVTLIENAVKHGQTDASGNLSMELQCHKNHSGAVTITIRHPGVIQDKGKGGLPGGLSLLKQQLKTVHHSSSIVELLQLSPRIVEARIQLTALPFS